MVRKTGGPTESYDDFTVSSPENDCRYAAYDFDFVTSENFQKSKIFLLHGLLLFQGTVPRCSMQHPRTCENFITLCERGYYNEVAFHGNIRNFMIQGGDPTGTGSGGESIW